MKASSKSGYGYPVVSHSLMMFYMWWYWSVGLPALIGMAPTMCNISQSGRYDNRDWWRHCTQWVLLRSLGACCYSWNTTSSRLLLGLNSQLPPNASLATTCYRSNPQVIGSTRRASHLPRSVLPARCHNVAFSFDVCGFKWDIVVSNVA